MKKIIAVFLTIAAALCLCSVTAFANDTIKAPEKVWYKLINHDKVALKWDTVEGADSYILYKLDAQTGKYGKVCETSKTNLTLKKLTADTEYTYAVRAVGGDGRSKQRTVTFTTPHLWNYETVCTDEDNKIYEFRRMHFDGSEQEAFADDFDRDIAAKKNDDYDEYRESHILPVLQKKGYVYYMRDEEDIDSGGYYYHLFRMNEDGSDIIDLDFSINYNLRYYEGHAKSFDVINERDVLVSEDTVLLFFDTGLYDYDGDPNEYSECCIKNKSDNSNIFKAKNKKMNVLLCDERYIYFCVWPNHYFSETDDPETDNCTIFYRLDTENNETDELCRYDNSDNTAVSLIDHRDNRLYYYTRIKKYENNEVYWDYDFFYIELTNANDKEYKPVLVNSSDLKYYIGENPLIGVYNESIYYWDISPKNAASHSKCSISVKAININTGREKTIRKIKVDDNKIQDTEINSGYIYFSSYIGDSKTYFRLKADGSMLSKSKKTFKWR